MTDMRLVGLDLSLAKTGITWTHDRNGQPSYGAETIETGKRGHDRLHAILSGVAYRCAMRPTLCAVEGLPLYTGKGNTTIHLAELHGIVKHWLWGAGITYVDISPATLKVWATGRGDTSGENKVTKQEVLQAIVAEYGRLCPISDDNQADAMAAMSLAAHAYADPITKVYNPTRLRAVDSVRWPQLGAAPTRRTAR